ncbi:hypothetical protein PPGU16_83410 (plasmid) [Paraburkholderia largidicola]|uniref:Uncharacterized protein n=1 Tax=Paraburkholderia largidicola TaxID=3014751 RepID=A0A7I8C2L3_9BURK|nr:hypothetical protein PPGU16_83410 [Paraburkholderia sp. PGU16]
MKASVGVHPLDSKTGRFVRGSVLALGSVIMIAGLVIGFSGAALRAHGELDRASTALLLVVVCALGAGGYALVRFARP